MLVSPLGCGPGKGSFPGMRNEMPAGNLMHQHSHVLHLPWIPLRGFPKQSLLFLPFCAGKGSESWRGYGGCGEGPGEPPLGLLPLLSLQNWPALIAPPTLIMVKKERLWILKQSSSAGIPKTATVCSRSAKILLLCVLEKHFNTMKSLVFSCLVDFFFFLIP